MNLHKIKNKIAKELENEIPELFENSDNFTIIPIKSRKNLVYILVFNKKPKRFPREIVIKFFQTNNATKERDILNKLKKQEILVPKVLFFKEPYLILEKIDGVNLCDFINENLDGTTHLNDINYEVREKMISGIKMLANWMAKMHRENIVNSKDLSKIIVVNKGDTRLRDFIIKKGLSNVSDDKLYGFDFEDSYEGNHIDDLAWICCALLDTNPGILEMDEPKHKIELINIFLKEYYHMNNAFSFNFGYFAQQLIEFLNVVIERRELKISPVRKNSILNKISEDF